MRWCCGRKTTACLALRAAGSSDLVGRHQAADDDHQWWNEFHWFSAAGAGNELKRSKAITPSSRSALSPMPTMNYMNDGLRTNIFVRYSPETIACACIYLSARQHKVALPMSPPWYEVFKCNEEQLKDIAFNILHVYIHEAQSKEKLEEVIQRLKDQLLEAKAKAKTESASIVSSALSGVPNSSVASNPSGTIASAQRHNNNNSITSGTSAAAHMMSSASRRGSNSNHQSPNSRNSSPSSRDHRKDKENRKRISPPVDSGDDLGGRDDMSPSENHHPHTGSRSYHHHHKHKHQKKKSKSKDVNKYYHRKDKERDYYYSQSSLQDWGTGTDKNNGSAPPRKQKHYNRSPPTSYDDNSIPPVKRSRKADKREAAGDMMTSSHSEDSSPEHLEPVHSRGGGKKHKRKSSRDGGGAKHKSRSNKASYKERNTRYY